ncbi:MAG: hypothetical protein AB8G99_26250 [Planctomycetaceae bacterium]
MRLIVSILQYIWALPNTSIGLVMGGVGLATGGRVQRHGVVLEFHGGFVTLFMRIIRKAGMTLGYVILGPDTESLNIARAHELVHVEQYGRWGPLFLPAYVLSSLVQWLKGKRPYRDNFLEVEAYAREPINPISDDGKRNV